MKKYLHILFVAAALAVPAGAATINWAAGLDNGFSLANGTDLSQGSLIRLGYFYDSSNSQQLSDTQIRALANTPTLLDTYFKEAANTFIGANFGVAGHFSADSTVDTSALNIAGAQMYLWVFNTGAVNTATQQGVFYWSSLNTSTNPDGTPLAPGLRWSFPTDDMVPGSTSIDLTDLTTNDGSALASGAHVVIGSFGTGTSDATFAPNFNLAAMAVPEPSTAFLALAGGVTMLVRRRRTSTTQR
jgi:hypothetical protein